MNSKCLHEGCTAGCFELDRTRFQSIHSQVVIGAGQETAIDEKDLDVGCIEL